MSRIGDILEKRKKLGMGTYDPNLEPLSDESFRNTYMDQGDAALRYAAEYAVQRMKSRESGYQGAESWNAFNQTHRGTSQQIQDWNRALRQHLYMNADRYSESDLTSLTGEMDSRMSASLDASKGIAANREYWRRYGDEQDWLAKLALEAADRQIKEQEAARLAAEQAELERLRGIDISRWDSEKAEIQSILNQPVRSMLVPGVEARRPDGTIDLSILPDVVTPKQQIDLMNQPPLPEPFIPAGPDEINRVSAISDLWRGLQNIQRKDPEKEFLDSLFAPETPSLPEDLLRLQDRQLQQQADDQDSGLPVYGPEQSGNSDQSPSKENLDTLSERLQYLETSPDYQAAKYAQIEVHDDFETTASKGAAVDLPDADWESDDKARHMILRTATGPQKVLIPSEYRDNPNQVLRLVTDSEKKKYNYLLASEGIESAREYLGWLTPTLNQRYANQLRENASSFGSDHPGWASLDSVLSSLEAGSGAFYATGKWLQGEDIDPAHPAFGAGIRTDAIRGAVSEDIYKDVGGGLLGETLTFLYNTGMSMGDFLINAWLVGGVSPKAAQLLMSTRAASETTRDILERGGTQNQAIFLGMVAGGAEAFFERFSLDRFLQLSSSATQLAFVKNVLKSAGIELSEEFATELTNLIAEETVMGDMSKYSVMRQELIEQGITPEVADATTRSEMAKQLALAAAGGFLSGGVLGGVSATTGAVRTYNLGSQIQNQGLVDNVLARGAASPADSLAYQQAQDNMARQSEGSRLSASTLGRQQVANLDALSRDSNQQAYRDALQYLTGSGVTGRAAMPGADLALAMLTGKMSRQQAQAAMADPTLRGVYEGLAGAVPEGAKPKDLVSRARVLAPGATFGARTTVPTEAAPQTAQDAPGSPAPQGVPAGPAGTEARSAEPVAFQEAVPATYTASGDPVSVTGIAAVEDGVTYLALEGGGRATAEDLEFERPEQRALFEASGDSDTMGARSFVTGYDPALGGVEVYAQGFKRFFDAGRMGVDKAAVQSSPFAAALSPTAQELAYMAGQRTTEGDSGTEAAFSGTEGPKTRTEAPSSAETPAAQEKGELKPGLNRQDSGEPLSRQQRTELRVLDALGKQYDLPVVLVDSIEGAASAAASGVNGYYDPETGAIYIARDAMDGAYLFVGMHELVHHVKAWNTEGYEALEAFILARLEQMPEYTARGSLNERIQRLMDALGITRSQAIEEIVADAVPVILTDEASVRALVEHDRTLAQRIADFFADFLAKLRDLVSLVGVTRGRDEVIALQADVKAVETIDGLFRDALEGAWAARGETGNLTGEDGNRYSMRDISSVDAARIEQENERLRGLNESLANEFKLTKGHKLSDKALDQLAGRILRQHQSQYDRATLTGNLRALFEYLGNEESIVWDDVMELSAAIGKAVLEKSTTLDRTLFNQYEDLRAYFKDGRFALNDEQKAEVAAQFDSYGAFRRKQSGRFTLADDGQSLDSMWGEISGKWPELFSADTSVAEQPLAVAQALGAIQPQPVNPYGYDLDGAAADLAREFYRAFFEIPEVRTYADKQRKQMDLLRLDYQNKLQDARERAKDQYERNLRAVRKDAVARRQALSKQIREAASDKQRKALMDQYRRLTDRRVEQLARQKAAFQEWKVTDRARRAERAEGSKARRSIEKHVRDLYTWVAHPTDAKHVPEAMRHHIVKFLETIDFTQKNDRDTKKAQEWRERVSRLKDIMVGMDNAAEMGPADQGFYMDVDPDLPIALTEFLASTEGVARISEMTNAQLEVLDGLLGRFVHAVKTSNKLLANARYTEVAQVGEASMKHMNARQAKRGRGWLARTADDFLNMDQLDVFSYFEGLGPEADSIRASLSKGFDTMIRDVAAAEAFIAKTIDKKLVRAWEKQKQTFKLENGSVELTVAQMMDLYELSKRPQALGHILAGGIKVEVEGGPGLPPISLTAADVAKVADALTDKQKQVADELQRYMGNDSAAQGNEASMQMYGYKKFTESNYYPIRSDDNYLRTKDSADDNGSLHAIRNLGMTKAVTPGANNPILVGSMFSTFARHTQQMAAYHGLAAPLSDAIKWYNFRLRAANPTADVQYLGSVKQSIERTMGKAGKAYFVNFVRDLNGVRDHLYGGEIGGKFISNYKASAVGANLRVILQQSTSYVRAYAVMDAKYLVAALAQKPNIAEAQKYAPIAKWKDWGAYDIGTGKSMEQILYGGAGLIDTIRSATMKPAGIADNLAWGTLWNATKMEIRDTRPNLKAGSAEFFEAVADRFTDVVNRTQVVDSVFHRSQNMRGKDGLVKTFTAFMAEPTKTYNLIRSALVAAARGDAGAQGRLARTVLAVLLSSMFTGMAAAVMDAFRDDDEKKDWIEKWVDAAVQNTAENINPLSNIPILRDAWSIIQGYDVERMDMAWFAALWSTLKKWGALVSGESKMSTYGLVSQTVKDLSKLFGIPAGNLLRETETFAEFFFPGSIQMDSETATLESTYRAMVAATDAGDKAKVEQLRSHLTTKRGKEASDITTGMRGILAKEDARIAQAGDARMSGDLTTYERIVREMKAKGFDQDLVVTAINNYIEAQKKAAKGDASPTATPAPVSLYTSGDLAQAVIDRKSGNAQKIVAALRAAGRDDSSIRSAVTAAVKPVYVQYAKAGQWQKVWTLEEDLFALDLGYDSEDFSAWVK